MTDSFFDRPILNAPCEYAARSGAGTAPDGRGRRGDPDGNLWVIAGRKPGSHLIDLQHPWRRIRARARFDDVRIHDLRHSCVM